MPILKLIAALFLLPGTIVLSMLNISLEDDGGVFRSLINMLFWGLIGALIVLKTFL